MSKKQFVSNKDECVRMFESSWLEKLTRIHFTIPLFIFVPVILFFLYKSIFIFELPISAITGYFFLGLFVWTFTEYFLHRFVFHWELPGEWGKQIHFIFHGVHHDYPHDSKRLVMVPTVSIPLAVLFYYLFYLMLGEMNVAPFFVGFLIGYLFYDMTHYAVHHFNLKSKFWLELKQHHMVHHYKDDHNGFGVSSKFWDLVFRTTFKRKAG